MEISSQVTGDWLITLEGIGECQVEGKNFFNSPRLGDYARFAFESFTREWVEDTVNPSDMFELKSVDEANSRATLAVKNNAMDFAGEDLTIGGEQFKLSRTNGLVQKPEG